MNDLFVLGGLVTLPLISLFVIVLGAREVPKTATLLGLASLALGYVLDGPLSAMFGAYLALMGVGLFGLRVRTQRREHAEHRKLQERIVWPERYSAAIIAGDLTEAKRLLRHRPAR